ncbi:hypothetical protein EJ05DRAFT_537072 [Pseudovirgaria hyperparasitica]|uniref:Uncharacterized protein n=1 Tax=Pseudovirgaria hyperparasitica TaxID=470096 RepID=A0A6A6WFG2_9PEZI|nr:uncharacterized protein EJ05DRAFT_537072 [Pseudovirgaria hyperparasitica]KAF2759851.1 hypothetical protein EJ05DRAFT_537072 [Pseudovirgaria hyperparasitica]
MTSELHNMPKPHFRSKEEKQLMRFYEPLVLLHTLGRSRGDRTQNSVVSTGTFSERRKFLNNLAYICDFNTGGDTVTSIALQDCADGPIYWVASNSEKKVLKSHEFLMSVLSDLSRVSAESAEPSPEHKERLATELSEKIIVFAKKRINGYRSHLRTVLPRAIDYLQRRDAVENSDILDWLNSWRTNVYSEDVCRLAYDARRSENIRVLRNLGEKQNRSGNRDSIYNILHSVRHYIGRLGYHFCVAKALLNSARPLATLLTSYEVRIVAPMPPGEMPDADSKTKLDGILVRMMPNNAVALPSMQENLQAMDDKFGLTKRYLELYTDRKYSTSDKRRSAGVHAEIKVLEYFFTQKFRFVDNDKFIATSKPSCYCCHLYFKHHPLMPSEPATHCNIYLNWRPPQFVGEHFKNSVRDHPRHMLFAMIPDIRQEALQQILERSPPRQSHPDSNTGITESANLGHASIPDLSHELERLSLAGDIASCVGDYSDDIRLSDLESSDDEEGGGISLLDYE